VRLVQEVADYPGISYLRTTRPGTPTIYGPDEDFPIGGAKVVRESPDDQVALIGAGATLHEAIKAADELAGEGIKARVIDLYSVKPLDYDTLAEASAATDGRLIVAEDHRPEGGIGEAVISAFADKEARPHVTKLAVRELPGSGNGAELMHQTGIDAQAIAAAARRLVDLGPQITTNAGAAAG
jgi:transketolase